MPNLNSEKKNRLRWLLLPACNLVYMVGLMLLCTPRWNANDDYGIIAIAAGAIGAADAHVSFANVILGALLKLLGAIAPGIGWYWLIQLCTAFAAYNAIGYVALRRLGLRWGLLFYLPFMAAGGYDFYITWTFTRTASLATAAGWLCWLWAVEALKQRRGALLGGAVLIVGGYLIRPESGAMITALAMALAFGQWLTAVIRRRSFKAQTLRTVALTVLPVLLLALCFAIDTAAYQTPGWKAYRTYDASRTGVFDFNCSSYAENPEAFAALGLTEEDYALATGWNYADFEKLDGDTLAAIMELPSESKGRLSGWTLQNSAMRFVQNKLMLLGLLLALLLLCLTLRFRWLPVMGLFGGTMVLLAVLDYIARFPARVLDSIGIALAALLLGVHDAADFPPADKKQPSWPVLLAVTVAVPLLLNGERWLSPDTYRYQGLTEAQQQEKLAELDEKTDASFLYLEDVDAQIFFWDLYPLWAAPLPGSEQNFYALGGWHLHMPITDAVLESYGVDNPMASFGENDRVLLMDSTSASVQQKMEYLRRNYHPDITWSVYDTVLNRLLVSITDRPTDLGPENTDVLLQFAAGQENEYVTLSGTVQGDTVSPDTPESDTVRCLLIQDASGVTKAFRFRLQQGEAGGDFTVQVPRSELAGNDFTVSYGCRPAGTAAFAYHTLAQPLHLDA